MGRAKINPGGEHHFKCRLPLALWKLLEKEAKRQRRSVNAHIVWVLEEHARRRRGRPG